MSLRWRQVDEHWALSQCGRYTVTRDATGFLAWYRIGAQASSVTGIAPLCLARSSNSKGAAGACRKHQQSVDTTTHTRQPA